MRDWIYSIWQYVRLRITYKEEVYRNLKELDDIRNFIREAALNNCDLHKMMPSKTLMKRYGLNPGRNLTHWKILEDYVLRRIEES